MQLLPCKGFETSVGVRTSLKLCEAVAWKLKQQSSSLPGPNSPASIGFAHIWSNSGGWSDFQVWYSVLWSCLPVVSSLAASVLRHSTPVRLTSLINSYVQRLNNLWLIPVTNSASEACLRRAREHQSWSLSTLACMAKYWRKKPSLWIRISDPTSFLLARTYLVMKEMRLGAIATARGVVSASARVQSLDPKKPAK